MQSFGDEEIPEEIEEEFGAADITEVGTTENSIQHLMAEGIAG
jgi:hypothetical protein